MFEVLYIDGIHINIVKPQGEFIEKLFLKPQKMWYNVVAQVVIKYCNKKFIEGSTFNLL